MPVCEDCLNLLVEKYWWDENSLKVKRSKGLFLYPIKSKDEVFEELDRYLSPLPLFREKRLASDNLVVHRLIRTPEFRRIPLLREA